MINEQEINKIWMFLIPMMGLWPVLLHLDLLDRVMGADDGPLIDEWARQEPDHKENRHAEDDEQDGRRPGKAE